MDVAQNFPIFIEHTMYDAIARKLLLSDEPSVRWKVKTNVFGVPADSREIRALQKEIRNCRRVKTLLQSKGPTGIFKSKNDVYDKWQGAHWVLNTLADIGYPGHDRSLLRAGRQILDFWLSPYYLNEVICTTPSQVHNKKGVPLLNGRYRRCASQQGNALYYLLQLGIGDDRVHQLAERLLHWQWPDGGWNCDKNPSAHVSTFIHTLWGLRGLACYRKFYKRVAVQNGIDSAANVLLERRLFRRKTNGKIIHREFTRLHYPLYWHYDILGALKVLAEAGKIHDERCEQALDLLESKIIPGKGWPAESRYYKVSAQFGSNNDYVNWGGTGTRKINEWITADALHVLKAAGRW